jgi:cholest-4-en-3-one 26-monooxygenase
VADAGHTPPVAAHLLDPDLLCRGVPHDLYDRLRAADPVCWQALPDGGGYWALLTHADVVRVSSEPTLFSAERKGMMLEDLTLLPTLLNLDPPAHAEVRRPLVPLFAPQAAATLEPRMRALLRDLFAGAAARGGCDFATDLAAPLPLAIICDMLGVPEEDRARLGHWGDVMAAADDPELGRELQGRAQNEAAMELGMYGYRLGETRRADAGDDLVARLMRATIGGRAVDLATFSGLFVQILIGGNETTRSLLCGGFLALVERPDAYAALAADPALIPGTVEEMLRWVSPVHYFRRTATRDTELGGHAIRAGDRVVMLYAAANRDPAAFDAPERFDVRRAPNPHVAFGFGEHFCLGARIARLETRVFLEEFLRRFAGLELDGPVERVRSNQLNSVKRMPVRLRPR